MAMFTSNCHNAGASGRFEYVQELMKHVKVTACERHAMTHILISHVPAPVRDTRTYFVFHVLPTWQTLGDSALRHVQW